MLRVFIVLLAAGLAAGQTAQPEIQNETPNADDIMARVAANQDRSEALRKEYVYRQHIHIVTHKPNILDLFGKDWFEVKEGEASIFKPDGAGGYTLIARVPIDQWKVAKP